MKKLLNIFTILTLFSVFTSCKDEEQIYFDGDSLLHFEKGTLTAPDGDYMLPYGVTKAVGGDHNVTLVFDQAKSTAVLGTDFTIVQGADILKDGTARSYFKLNVTKAAAIAKKNAVFTMSNTTLPRAIFNQEVKVNFACTSALAGTYQYSTVNAFAPGLAPVSGPVTGNVTLTANATGNEYTISDSSFGAYSVWSGYAPISTGIRLVDQCNTLSFAGANLQYGDTWSISNVVVNGNKLTFQWTTSYGEYATTTLTKSNGNWPPLN